MEIQSVIKDLQYKVLVKCMTYNQSQYIEDALNGFVIQQTSFPVVYAIVDDASTDGEREKISSYIENNFDASSCEKWSTDYADFQYATHATNKMCHFLICLLRWNHYRTLELRIKKNEYLSSWFNGAEFIALCEGDDYWTDPFKLQKQVDFLEKHPDVTLSCCRYNILGPDSEMRLAHNSYFETADLEQDYFMFTRDDAFGEKGWITKTLTCVFKRSAYDLLFCQQFKYCRDVHMFYNVLSSGLGVCHSFIGGVYRVTASGVFGGKSDKEKILINYRVYSELFRKVHDPVIGNSVKNFCYALLSRKCWPFPYTVISLRCYLSYIKHKLLALRNCLFNQNPVKSSKLSNE